jgi:hypothetical protein
MRFLIFLICFLSAVAGFSQTATDKAVQEACACMQKLDAKKLANDALQKGGMECMMQAMGANTVELAKEYGYDPTQLTEETGRLIGEKFGMQLATKCPAAMPVLVAMSGQAQSGGQTMIPGYEGQGQTSGTFVRLDLSGELAKVVIKTAVGEETFYWIRPFPGADNLEKQAATLKGKKVQVDWSEFKKYSPAAKTYAKVKEVSAFRMVK